MAIAYRLLLCIACCGLSVGAGLSAQTASWSFGGHVGPTTYRGDLSADNFGTMRGAQLGYGLQARYQPHPHWSLQARLQHGLVEAADRYFKDDTLRQLRDLAFRTSFTDLALLLQFSPGDDRRPVRPEIAAGFGFTWFQAQADFSGNAIPALNDRIKEDQLVAFRPNSPIVPLRLGLRWQAHPNWSVIIGWQYNITFTDYFDGISQAVNPDRNDHYGLALLGIQYDLRTSDLDGDGIPDEHDHCPLHAGLARLDGCPDADGDGIPDEEDNCPLAPGFSSLRGCPDTDKDGVPDPYDRCPAVAGAPEAGGCPVVDSDGDGLEDHLDDCPLQAGPANRKGCPAIDSDGDGLLDEDDACPGQFGPLLFQGCPDTDGDGIQDNKDACPNQFGVYAAQGCPLVSDPAAEAQLLSSQVMFFAPGSSAITNYSLLDKLAAFLNKHPRYRLHIVGHADSRADDAPQLDLSLRRARAVRQYLMEQGVADDRLSARGEGERYPLGASGTLAGSNQNRRVDFQLY